MHALEQLGSFFHGSGIGIVLVHGLAGTPTEMKAVARRLNKYGFSVLCPALAGHCASEDQLLSTGWTDWAESVKHACAEMSKYMEAVFIGGLSAGAVLSMRQAQLYPENIRGMALYSTFLRADGWRVSKLNQAVRRLLLHLPFVAGLYRAKAVYPYGIMNEKLRRRMNAGLEYGTSTDSGHACTPGLSLRELQKLIRVVKKDLPLIETPTLLLHAAKDDIASSRNSYYVQRHISGPSELVLLDNCYHLITIDQERDVVSDITASYFTSLLDPAEKTELALHTVYDPDDDEATPCHDYCIASFSPGSAQNTHRV